MVYEETKGRYRLAIYTDDNPISPRQMDANIGRMVCFHSRYHLGDRHDYANKDEFLLDLLSSHFMDEDEAILLSLFSGHPVIFAAGCTEEYPFD